MSELRSHTPMEIGMRKTGRFIFRNQVFPDPDLRKCGKPSCRNKDTAYLDLVRTLIPFV